MSTTPIVVTWHQALVSAGSADSDSVWQQDQLLAEWIGNRSVRVVALGNRSYESIANLEDLPQVDIVIIKEKSNDQS
ncbi:MAG: hypothetical protein EBU08_19425 [Micrococcales bacterium]|nr:hypothetical protein [Micrococcales bacterium]